MLRCAASGGLLAFWGSLAWFLYQDYRATSALLRTRHEKAGRLVVIASDNNQPVPGDVLPLVHSTTMGRSASNTIQIDDQFASNHHARVIHRMGQWWLEDQHSRNGTALNGQRIDEPVVLSTGDIIGIGAVELRLELD